MKKLIGVLLALAPALWAFSCASRMAAEPSDENDVAEEAKTEPPASRESAVAGVSDSAAPDVGASVAPTPSAPPPAEGAATTLDSEARTAPPMKLAKEKDATGARADKPAMAMALSESDGKGVVGATRGGEALGVGGPADGDASRSAGGYTAAAPQAPALRASSTDDNERFGQYTDYVQRFSYIQVPKVEVARRIVIQALDRDGKAAPFARLAISAGGKEIWRGETYANGETLFHPLAYVKDAGQTFKLKATYQGETLERSISGAQDELVSLKFKVARQTPEKIPVDIAFCLDTTGSMGDEIARLKDTLFAIHHQIVNLPVAASVNFGMVLYRDKGDEYVTQVHPFTGDVMQFQETLEKVGAGGGGDMPENVFAGLQDTLTNLKWRDQAVRLVFLVADAPPQYYKELADRDQIWAAKYAQEHGIKIYTVGASGLDPLGEFVFRQLAQFTFAQYLFLHYGEQGESSGDGADAGRVSHHSGTDYQLSNLDQLIVDIIRKELSYFFDVTWADYQPSRFKEKEDQLETRAREIVEEMLYQLGASGAKKEWRVALLPLEAGRPELAPLTEYLADLIAEALVKHKEVTLIDRKNMQTIVQEHSFQLSDLADETKTIQMGKLLGADTLLTGKLYVLGDNRILYLKATAVETAKVTAMARTRW